MCEMNWLKGLDAEVRVRVFAVMRALDGESSRFAYSSAKQTAPAGMVSVGSAFIDDFIKSQAINEILRALRCGKKPDEAEAMAKACARDCVSKHNAKSHPRKNPTWARWEGTADSFIEFRVTKIKEAASSVESVG